MGEIADFESPVLSIEQDEGVATVWLDRAEARNAMGPDLWRDLPRAMAAVSADTAVRAVVIAAKGPHFSVGLDLKAMGSVLAGWRRPRGVGRRIVGRLHGGPGARRHAPRCSACRTPSPRSRAARSRSSPPSTATASAAAWT